MKSQDGTFDDWLTWCPRCHRARSSDGRDWFDDETLHWPGTLVPYTGQHRITL